MKPILLSLLALLPGLLSASDAPAWRAELRVKVTGCTSCADCRSSIRQISQAKSGIDKVEFADNIVRIVYPEPAPIRALEVARAIHGSELLRVKVARVELRVAGTLELREGKPFFRTGSTGQDWPMASVPEGLEAGSPAFVTGTVGGWKDETSPPVLTVDSVEPL